MWKLDNNKVISLSIYDIGSGIAEIKSVKDESVIIQWIIFTACYKSQLYGLNMYTAEKEILIKEICDIKSLSMTYEKILAERDNSIKCDAEIFKDYDIMCKNNN